MQYTFIRNNFAVVFLVIALSLFSNTFSGAPSFTGLDVPTTAISGGSLSVSVTLNEPGHAWCTAVTTDEVLPSYSATPPTPIQVHQFSGGVFRPAHKLSGTYTGFGKSDATSYANAFDGDKDTFFQGEGTDTNAYVVLQLNGCYVITEIQFRRKSDGSGGAVSTEGGFFEGATQLDSVYEKLSKPMLDDGVESNKWISAELSSRTKQFRQCYTVIRYRGAVGSLSAIADIEIKGYGGWVASDELQVITGTPSEGIVDTNSVAKCPEDSKDSNGQNVSWVPYKCECTVPSDCYGAKWDVDVNNNGIGDNAGKALNTCVVTATSSTIVFARLTCRRHAGLVGVSIGGTVAESQPCNSTGPPGQCTGLRSAICPVDYEAVGCSCYSTDPAGCTGLHSLQPTKTSSEWNDTCSFTAINKRAQVFARCVSLARPLPDSADSACTYSYSVNNNNNSPLSADTALATVQYLNEGYLGWIAARNYCVARGRVLCNKVDYCPKGDGTIPCGGAFPGVEAWSPIGDTFNEWVSVGDTGGPGKNTSCYTATETNIPKPDWGVSHGRPFTRSADLAPGYTPFRCCRALNSPAISGGTLGTAASTTRSIKILNLDDQQNYDLFCTATDAPISTDNVNSIPRIATETSASAVISSKVSIVSADVTPPVVKFEGTQIVSASVIELKLKVSEVSKVWCAAALEPEGLCTTDASASSKSQCGTCYTATGTNLPTKALSVCFTSKTTCLSRGTCTGKYDSSLPAGTSLAKHCAATSPPSVWESNTWSPGIWQSYADDAAFQKNKQVPSTAQVKASGGGAIGEGGIVGFGSNINIVNASDVMSMKLTGLPMHTPLNVYCYAEDFASAATQATVPGSSTAVKPNQTHLNVMILSGRQFHTTSLWTSVGLTISQLNTSSKGQERVKPSPYAFYVQGDHTETFTIGQFLRFADPSATWLVDGGASQTSSDGSDGAYAGAPYGVKVDTLMKLHSNSLSVGSPNTTLTYVRTSKPHGGKIGDKILLSDTTPHEITISLFVANDMNCVGTSAIFSVLQLGVCSGAGTGAGNNISVMVKASETNLRLNLQWFSGTTCDSGMITSFEADCSKTALQDLSGTSTLGTCSTLHKFTEVGNDKSSPLEGYSLISIDCSGCISRKRLQESCEDTRGGPNKWGWTCLRSTDNNKNANVPQCATTGKIDDVSQSSSTCINCCSSR